jgi:hypothetical protein
MRILIAAAAVATSALVAAGALGVAGADTTPAPAPTSVLPRTVSVQGVASAPVASEASVATATAAYRQAMASAVADGQSKAQFLAEKAGAALGAVQSIGEGGGYISCPGEEEYQGGQPDFGSAGGGETFAAAPSVAGATVRHPAVRKPAAKHRKRHTAKQATAESCTLSTQVALAYLLS